MLLECNLYHKERAKMISTKAWLTQHGINLMISPPESPDLNPIENLWALLKHHIRRKSNPTTKDELLNSIKEFWGTTVTPELCQRYISHLRKVIPAVILRDGAATGY